MTTENFQKYETSLGTVYFFNNYFIAEFKEGINIDFFNFQEIHELVHNNFGNSPFGFISNRINSYSIDLNEAQLFNESYPNLKAYAVVAYKAFTERVFELENRFFQFRRRVFKDIDSAVAWVESQL
ncbi:hypothetical protein J4050_12620 [Winogradskyella sp. DF17]|jgi:hypothetical protein|uniref:STAS/SEC14 domain-containing protein n=1 Tax=Winogradskyella pelagia TaxID=2819984 RepID=A0ABS3T4D0_9FLAO|nr:hypothetical protein [Winogradskyella sp. DF17]MBO3117597.1 hypothetical protein [Winogradskyella sp. DF17]